MKATIYVLITAAMLSMTLGNANATAASSPKDRYYRYVHPDTRKCASPICGGFYVKAVNTLLTQCADGSWHIECYVSGFDTQQLNWGEDTQNAFNTTFAQKTALVRGQILNTPYHESAIQTLVISEAWVEPSGKIPTGSAVNYYQVKHSGIICKSTPCPNWVATILNGSIKGITFAELDLNQTGADQATIDQAIEQATNSNLLVAGHYIRAGLSFRLIANAFYVPASAQSPSSGTACGGSQGELCQQQQFCDIATPNSCQATGLSGICITPPQICYQIYVPVCGCDGQTYANDCYRQTAGVQLDHADACAVPIVK